ncbi:MAG: 30S ribosomal protein S1 [Amphibacillus sp.]|uniref:30S ribosomal protein S1 n=1 Tax=Amphibacillus xylanus (strain ATCC 51415 / DSM 6626 / JCM 7361 / LMG 17667 / NBRC 15112 / Ep01) TaxID=698758 RepID=K0J7F6_AMPXN|nr:30S ribosomal protein S1 [Amphibacillus xylanus]NMA91373.1 30S ribosomal protein S1 [Amphibacillus sp.]BAM47363.1 30S ribosomal protein S1 [Amphibacillus xylanus NBRC 15112]
MDEMNKEVSELKDFSVGQEVTGKVVKVEDNQVLVDIGWKTDGIVPLNELTHLHVESASEVVNLDDELTLKINKITDDEVILSKQAVDTEKAWADLENKLASGEVFEATVKEIVKGGLVVDVGVRGFVPASLVEVHYVEDFSTYLDTELTLKVVELDRSKNRVILSHRAVVEEESEKLKEQRLASLEEGQVVEGKVARITDFGAFIDLGGIDGLVHISELAHEHVNHASDVISEGETVKVKVLSVDVESERISLSIKATLPGPWAGIEDKIKPGDIVKGTVKRLVNFGAFVEIFPRVEGLVHISQISTEHIGTPHEVLEVDQEIEAKVLDVNEDEKRISLSIRELEADKNQQELKSYEKDEDQGFSISDVIGDQLDKFK